MRANHISRNVIVTITLLVCCGWSPHNPTAATRSEATVVGPRRNGGDVSSKGFEPNRGQAIGSVKFLSRGDGYTLFLTDAEAVISVRPKKDRPPLSLRMRPVGAKPGAQIAGEIALGATVNYLRDARTSPGLQAIPTYRRVRYAGVYEGIDLLFYDNGEQLEYDFVVAAGSDPGHIRLEFAGADRVSVNADGELVLHTTAGELRQPAPIVYQESGGVRTLIPGAYEPLGKTLVGFHIGAYDREQPLTIDPVLAYSTYLGGASEESGRDIVVDAGGNAYVVGARPSIRGPEFQDSDAYVAKFSASGALLWTTDVGDHCDDDGRGIALDTTGNIYITGSLGSCYPFPTLTAGAFVAKLTATGAGSYMFAFSDEWYGGADVGQAVAVNAAGQAYVGGITTTDHFPVTAGAFQQFFGGGIGDGFVVKVNATGTALLFATYLGGNAYESLNDVALDAAGNAYVVGSTESHDFPTRNAFQPVHPGWGPGDQGGFVTKLNATGSGLVYSTYLGGGPADIAQSVAVDALGNAYVAGITQSTEFPITPGAAQPLPGDDRWCYYTICTDAFVTKLNAAGNGLVYSTYLGGNIFDEASGIAVDGGGNAYVTGNTLSSDFPTIDAFQPNSAGNLDAFVTKLNAAGSAFVYSSYLGGSVQSDAGFEGEDGGLRIAVQPGGTSAYVIGNTRSPDFPVVSAHQPAFGGGVCGWTDYRCSDAFVTKIGGGCTFTIAPASQTIPSGGGTGTIGVTASAAGCTWTAVSAAPWVSITSGGNGTGNATVGYSAGANATGAARTGTINVAGHIFTVTQPAAVAASVTVAAPNGGEKLFTATPFAITWTATGGNSFDVHASVDGGITYAPVPGCLGLAATARSCVWAAPGPAATSARVRVTAHTGGASVADASNALFSIVAGAATVNVTFPNKLVDVGIGSTQVITWSHNLGLNTSVKIELSRDGGVTYPQVIAAAHQNAKASSGSFNWVVPGPATIGAKARIRVSWVNGPAADASDLSFVIAPAFINVTTPAASGSWALDSTQLVKWTTNLGALDRVNVQLSVAGLDGPFATMTGGGNILAIKNKAQVLVPQSATTSARVRVIWANPPAGFAASGHNPGNFRVEAPFITISAPTTSHVWPIGTSRTIQWTSNLGSLEKVDIRLSRDAGATYPVLIADMTPSDGKHTVTVSAAWGSQSNTRVKIAWLKNAAVVGVSGSFVIQ